MLVVLEVFHLFFIRIIYETSLSWRVIRATRAVWIALAIIVPAHFTFRYLPTMQDIFGASPVSLFDGILIVAGGAAFLAIIEVEKKLRLRAYPPTRAALSRTA